VGDWATDPTRAARLGVSFEGDPHRDTSYRPVSRRTPVAPYKMAMPTATRTTLIPKPGHRRGGLTVGEGSAVAIGDGAGGVLAGLLVY
jgi:hypothetical protein